MWQPRAILQSHFFLLELSQGEKESAPIPSPRGRNRLYAGGVKNKNHRARKHNYVVGIPRNLNIFTKLICYNLIIQGWFGEVILAHLNLARSSGHVVLRLFNFFFQSKSCIMA